MRDTSAEMELVAVCEREREKVWCLVCAISYGHR